LEETKGRPRQGKAGEEGREGGREGGRAYLEDESLVLVSEEDLFEEEGDGLLPGRELRLGGRGGREGKREGGREGGKEGGREGGREGQKAYLMWINLAPGKSSRRMRTRAVWEGD